MELGYWNFFIIRYLAMLISVWLKNRFLKSFRHSFSRNPSFFDVLWHGFPLKTCGNDVSGWTLIKRKAQTTLLLIFISFQLFAHGTKYEILSEKVIGIKAMYDTGEPIANAKVLVFAPDETNATCTTESDSNGVFYLVPDKAGTWTMQVRDKSGHGMRINLSVDESMQLTQASKSYGMTYLQKAIAALCVVWGCLGTALYFKRKASK